jgi:hypothetical protein
VRDAFGLDQELRARAAKITVERNEMKHSDRKRRRRLWRRPVPGVVSLVATLATWSQGRNFEMM